MAIGKLTVNLRHDKGKGSARRLRAQGLVPGVFYGSTLEAPMSITLDPKALKASLDPLKRQNTVITVDVVGHDTSQATVQAMLKDYQIHPIRRNVLHVDLVAIEPDKIVQAEVPVELTGKSLGVIEGGQLHVVRHSVVVLCKPADIPAKFEVDTTDLHIGDVFRLSDLQYPAGVEPTEDGKLPIVSCVAPVAEEEVKPEEEAAAEAVDGEAAPKDDEAADKAGGDAKAK